MSAVKFDKQEELDRLQAKIMLDLGMKLSKKDLLELLFEMGSQDYDRLLEYIRKNKTQTKDSVDLRRKFISKYSGIIELDEKEEKMEPKEIWVQDPEES
jgi:hypothetical protein